MAKVVSLFYSLVIFIRSFFILKKKSFKVVSLFYNFVILRIRVCLFSQRKSPCTFCSHSSYCTNWNFNGGIFIRRYIFQHNQYLIKCLLYMEWIDNICVYICLGRLWKHQFHFTWFNSNTKVKWLSTDWISSHIVLYMYQKQELSYWWNVNPTRNKECRQVLHWAQINVSANAIEIFFSTLVTPFL